MTDYKRGVILGSIFGLIIVPLAIGLKVRLEYLRLFSVLIWLFLGLVAGAGFGLLFSKLEGYFKGLWETAGLTLIVFYLSSLVFLEVIFSFQSNPLSFIKSITLVSISWIAIMAYFWNKRELGKLKDSLFMSLLLIMLIGGVTLSYFSYVSTFLFIGSEGTPQLLYTSFIVASILSAVTGILIYWKRKKVGLMTLVSIGVIFNLVFSVTLVGMHQNDILTRDEGFTNPPITVVSWPESACFAGKNWINSTVQMKVEDIPVDQGGTFLVKREGKILCEWNLSATDIGGGGIGDDNVLNQGETVSYDLDVSSSPDCTNINKIESNQDYTLELKINERPRDTFKTACTGKYY